jgi:putative colanic acid biosynthesis UDP-glucose lipid carrier transferase
LGLLERYHLQVQAVQRLSDPLIVVVGLWLLARGYRVPFEQQYQVLSFVAALTVAVTFGAAGAYRPRRTAPLADEARLTLVAWVAATGILLAIAYATKTSELFSRRVLLTWALTMPAALVAFHIGVRAVLRNLRATGRNSRSYVIVGGGDLARRLLEQVSANPWLGMRALGYFDDDVPPPGLRLPIPYLGEFADLAEFTARHSPNLVYIALPMRRETLIREVMDLLGDTAASVYLVPDIFTFQLLNARTEHLDGLPVIGLRETPFTGADGWLKRAEDVVLASVIVLLISPLLLLVAIGVKLSSPGPVIFKQRRYGLDGRPIRVYKFRTMTVCEDGETVRQATRSDARITRFGAFLRQTSLDELPQFWNVLQGRMSIVGPRPHAVAHNEQYRRQIKGYMLRHKVRPGITGLAQVNGFRGETDTLEKMQKRVAYDLNYIQGWSLQLDLKIIARTIVKGFRQDNAF